MQTDRLSRAGDIARAQPDAPLRILGVQDAAPGRWRGLVVTHRGARGQFRAEIGPGCVTLSAFGVTRTLPRLDPDPDWIAQEPCIVLGLALIVGEI